jgi:hypothetical protein
LQAATDTDGSMECVLTWSRKATPSGLRIYRLRASARRTSGNGCSGVQPYATPQSRDHFPAHSQEYLARKRRECNNAGGFAGDLPDQAALAVHPTPLAQHANGTPERFLERKRESVARGNSMGVCLTDPNLVSQLATHATPVQSDGKRGTGEMPEKARARKRGKPKTLGYEAALACHPTPMAGNPGTETYNPAGNTDSSRKTVEQTRDAAAVSGAGSTSFITETARRGVLNPELSRWLMGFPAAWGCCGATAMQSCRKSRRTSSGASLKRKRG